MLKKIDNKTVRGSDFSVAVLDIHTVEYAEGVRTAAVEIEGGTGPQGINWLVYSSTLVGWTEGGRIVTMDPLDRARVLARISEALTLLGMRHVLA